MPAVSCGLRRASWRCAMWSIATPARRCATTGWRLRPAPRSRLLVSVGPDRWTRSRCDAHRLQQRCGGDRRGPGAGAGGLVEARATRVTRVLRGGGAGCLAAAVLVLIEPRCARGPFAMVDPAIWPIWHDHVRELQPLIAVFRINPLTAAAIAAFPAMALLAMLTLIAEREAAPRLRLPHRELCLSRCGVPSRPRRSAAIPMRCGSACRWWQRWRCGCSRLCSSRRFAGAACDRTAAHAAGGVGRRHHHRPRQRA